MAEGILRIQNIGHTTGTPSVSDFVDEYGVAVYRFCRSLAYTKEDADDLYQETFLSVLEQPAKIGSSTNPRGFLFSAALYIWKSRMRKYARRRRIAPTDPLDEIHETAHCEVSIDYTKVAKKELRKVKSPLDDL